jgi:hypothetical protein
LPSSSSSFLLQQLNPFSTHRISLMAPSKVVTLDQSPQFRGTRPFLKAPSLWFLNPGSYLCTTLMHMLAFFFCPFSD